MRRREFLALSSLTLACGEVDMSRKDAIPFGMPPWHMWGNSTNIDFAGGPAKTGQLARINYGRPEHFRFLFELTLLSHLDAGQFLQANFILMVGIGRSNVILDPFATLMIRGAADNGAQVWRTRIMQPVTDPSPFDADVAEAIPTDVIVAQDLQCTVELFGTADLNIKSHVSAMFSPNVHVRPEWFGEGQPVDLYRGGENRGT